MKQYRMKLRPLTAVHVGTGDAINPLEYTLKKNSRGEIIFLRYFPEKIIQSLSGKDLDEFKHLSGSQDIVALRTFLGDRAGMESAWYVASVTSAFRQQVEQKKADWSNSLEVEEAYRAPGQHSLVLPGSSIKGALRTAVVSERARNYPQPEMLERFKNYRERYDTSFQRIALSFSVPNDDPFRALSVEDCPFPPKGTQLVGRLFQYKPYRKNMDPFESIAIHAEVVRGEFTGSTEAGVCRMLHDEALSGFRSPERGCLREKAGRKVIDRPLTIQEITKDTDEYYGNAFSKEFNDFFLDAQEESVLRAGKDLAARVDELSASGEHLIRIGRWSHVEAVTVEKYRQPKSNKGYGRTRTLFEYEGAHYPMGWCTYTLEEV